MDEAMPGVEEIGPRAIATHLRLSFVSLCTSFDSVNPNKSSCLKVCELFPQAGESPVQADFFFRAVRAFCLY